MSNVRMLEGGKGKDAFKDSIKNLLENLPHIIEHNKMMAQLHKAKYDALLVEGFNETQALELCKTVF